MITAIYRKGAQYANQRIWAHTVLFDKEYYWMSDVDETWYLMPVGDDGEPVFA